MGKALRTFVAVRCAPEVAARLRREVERLARLDGALRAPRTDEFHVTLLFLGDTDEADVPAIGRALADVARAHEPFDVTYVGLGAFPTPERARVVWAGVREEPERGGAYAELAGAVGDALGELGYPPEARAFRPHVTIGRVRKRPSGAFAQALRERAELDLGADSVSELKLILSSPGDRGYSYIDLTTADLGTDGM